ncbi:MAG: FHA domain-containing protein [Acidobacteria bacterium]|nr:FHA domain-containing protein [Acidobacteriota bacterium]
MSSVPVLRVHTGNDSNNVQTYHFQTTFHIGRTEECELRIDDSHISRKHAVVSYQQGQWWIQDLNSSNGILLNGERVTAAPVAPTLTVRLGLEGPWVWFEMVEQPAPAVENPAPAPAASHTMVLKSYTEKYLTPGVQGEAGHQTMMIRSAFQRVQKKQKSKFAMALGGVGLVALAIAGYAYYQHRELSERKALAQELFYQMKAIDVDIANVKAENVGKYRTRRQEMEKNYEKFLTTLKVYDPKMSEQDRLIMRISRVFGECELDIPPGFKEEVENYIKKWQGSGRYKMAVMRAKENHYTSRITNELLSQGLPPQFFYLAMQESNFDPFISGPPTYMGIAKGMWQFIPETGAKYGLKIGPLADLPRPDTGDDRHNWEKATGAASRYLKDLYSTDSLASGLLVMASYNWGEGRVIKRIKSLPSNARERNFWRLLTEFRSDIPQETYDYVFYIVSASVIGENPRLFGFDFDNPLAHLDKR